MRTRRKLWQVLVMHPARQAFLTDWATRLRDAIDKQDVTAADLARMLTAAGYPVSRAAVGYWLSAKNAPRPNMQAAVAHVLRLDGNELFPVPVVAA